MLMVSRGLNMEVYNNNIIYMEGVYIYGGGLYNRGSIYGGSLYNFY